MHRSFVRRCEMPVRTARYSDIPRIASTLSKAFYNEEFHAHLFPFRHEYPDDYLTAWKHVVLERWWDYHSIWYVYEGDQHHIFGAALWSRSGVGSDQLWGLGGWWDSRTLISPFVVNLHAIHRLMFPNRSIQKPSSSDPQPLRKWDFGDRISPFTSHYFTVPEHRKNHWELCILGVAPNHQRQGVGKELVRWGLSKAKEDKLPAVVITAAGTEKFYQKQGFEVYVGTASEEELKDAVVSTGAKSMNPLKQRGIGGGAIFWTKDVEVGEL